MTIALRHYCPPALLALALLACSSSHPSDPQTSTVAAAAAPMAASPVQAADSASTPAVARTAQPDLAAPELVAAEPATTGAPASPQSTPVTPTAEPPPLPTAQPNQTDQARLARQSAAAMEESATQPGAPSGVHGETATMSASTPLGHVHAPATALAHITAAGSFAHHAPTSSAAMGATQAAHATEPAAHTAIAQRRAQFASLAARFHRPMAISNRDPQTSPPPTTMSLKMGDIGISNFDDSVRVNFALKTADSDWFSDNLAPRTSKEFGCGFTGQCLFWMKTGDKPPVYYSMHHDGRYAILWDPAKAIWDLRIAPQGE